MIEVILGSDLSTFAMACPDATVAGSFGSPILENGIARASNPAYVCP
jgi:hypothetical protein